MCCGRSGKPKRKSKSKVIKRKPMEVKVKEEDKENKEDKNEKL